MCDLQDNSSWVVALEQKKLCVMWHFALQTFLVLESLWKNFISPCLYSVVHVSYIKKQTIWFTYPILFNKQPKEKFIS